MSTTTARSQTPSDRSTTRQFARSLFAGVLRACAVEPALRGFLRLERNRYLAFGQQRVDLQAFSRVFVVSVGKAAVPMSRCVFDLLTSRIALEGIVVGVGASGLLPGFAYFAGAHPVPDESSFAAASRVLHLLHQADENTLVLFLLSGGASAMLEAPLDPSIPEADVIEFYRLLLHAGLPIEKMNTLRKHLSAVKGGRMACAAAAATKATLLISDVPEGRLHLVGSGPSCADPGTVAECHAILDAAPRLTQALPLSVRRFFASPPETPRHILDGKLPSLLASLLSGDSLIEAAQGLASEAGFRVVIDNSCDDQDYRRAAQYLVARAQAESAHGAPVCLLSAGEVTVTLSDVPGTGGRNQQWALEAARLLHETGFAATALSAGSDGIDGNSPAAGAVVDSTTWTRALRQGLDPRQALQEFNAYPLFAALGDAIVTGPQGNNLRDLRVLLCTAS